MTRNKKATGKPVDVDLYMADLVHPLKAEVQALRTIIKNVHPGITEQIKWNAPSYSYTDYIATFNLRDHKRVHLVFHNPHIATISSSLLEGDYPDRRMAYFNDMQDVNEKSDQLVNVIHALVATMENQ